MREAAGAHPDLSEILRPLRMVVKTDFHTLRCLGFCDPNHITLRFRPFVRGASPSGMRCRTAFLVLLCSCNRIHTHGEGLGRMPQKVFPRTSEKSKFRSNEFSCLWLRRRIPF